MVDQPLPNQPITPDTAVTIAELIRLVDTLDRAVDGKDWALARSLLAPTMLADFESLSGQPAAEVSSDDVVAGWHGNLTALKTSYHQRSNHLVEVVGDRASVHSAGYAWNRMEGNGDPLWEVWGSYEHSLRREDDGWLIDGMALNVTHQRGNFWVRDTPGG